MSYTPPGRSESGGMDFSYLEDEAGYGLVTFAGVMLMIVAVLNTLYGIAAIDGANFFAGDAPLRLRRPQHVGLVPPGARRAPVLRRVRGLARRQRGDAGSASPAQASTAILQLLWIPAYPILAMTILALDIAVIYGLLAYGGRRRAARAARERAESGSAG